MDKMGTWQEYEITMQRELTTQQKNLIAMLVQHEHRIPVAAQQVGVPAHVAQTWMNLPYMRTAFDIARRETTTRLIGQARSGNFDGILPASLALKDVALIASTDKGQAAIERYIAQLQLYASLPIGQVLTWK